MRKSNINVNRHILKHKSVAGVLVGIALAIFTWTYSLKTDDEQLPLDNGESLHDVRSPSPLPRRKRDRPQLVSIVPESTSTALHDDAYFPAWGAGIVSVLFIDATTKAPVPDADVFVANIGSNQDRCLESFDFESWATSNNSVYRTDKDGRAQVPIAQNTILFARTQTLATAVISLQDDRTFDTAVMKPFKQVTIKLVDSRGDSVSNVPIRMSQLAIPVYCNPAEVHSLIRLTDKFGEVNFALLSANEPEGQSQFKFELVGCFADNHIAAFDFATVPEQAIVHEVGEHGFIEFVFDEPSRQNFRRSFRSKGGGGSVLPLNVILEIERVYDSYLTLGILEQSPRSWSRKLSMFTGPDPCKIAVATNKKLTLRGQFFDCRTLDTSIEGPTCAHETKTFAINESDFLHRSFLGVFYGQLKARDGGKLRGGILRTRVRSTSSDGDFGDRIEEHEVNCEYDSNSFQFKREVAAKGPYVVSIEVQDNSGWASAPREFMVAETKDKYGNLGVIELEPLPLLVAGQVINSSGQAVKDARILVSTLANENNQKDEHNFEGTTDSAGKFQIRGQTKSSELKIYARSKTGEGVIQSRPGAKNLVIKLKSLVQISMTVEAELINEYDLRFVMEAQTEGNDSVSFDQYDLDDDKVACRPGLYTLKVYARSNLNFLLKAVENIDVRPGKRHDLGQIHIGSDGNFRNLELIGYGDDNLVEFSILNSHGRMLIREYLIPQNWRSTTVSVVVPLNAEFIETCASGLRRGRQRIEKQWIVLKKSAGLSIETRPVVLGKLLDQGNIRLVLSNGHGEHRVDHLGQYDLRQGRSFIQVGDPGHYELSLYLADSSAKYPDRHVKLKTGFDPKTIYIQNPQAKLDITLDAMLVNTALEKLMSSRD